MALRAVIIDETRKPRGALGAALHKAGFEIEVMDPQSDPSKVMATLAAANVILYFVGAKTTPHWTRLHRVFQDLKHAALVYVIDSKNPKAKGLVPTELTAVLNSSGVTPKSLVHEVARVTKVRELYRTLNEPKSIALPVDENVFMERLDANHILDRTLQHFGQWMDAKNVHWVHWGEFESLLTKNQTDLAMEMEIHRGLHTPRLRAYRDCRVEDLLKSLIQNFTKERVENLKNSGAVIWRQNSATQVAVLVQDPEQNILGALWFEDVRDADPHSMIPSIQASLQHIGRFVAFGLSYWEARSQAMIDDLTGLFNQRFLIPVLSAEVARATRHKLQFTVLFLDMDRFKQINDQKGHWVGSNLLKAVGGLIRNAIRTCDFGFRYGGDEFVVILPETSKQNGHIVAERLRKSVEDSRFVIDGHDIRMTASVGVAGFPDDARTLEDILKMADQAMYLGKRGSRNVVYLAG